MKKKSIFTIIIFMLCMIPFFSAKMDVEAKVIYTTNAKVNAAAEKIIKKCTKEEMTKEQKLREVYLYLVKNMRYSWSTGRARIKVSSKEIQETKALAKALAAEGDLAYSSKFKKRYKNLLSLQGTCYGQSMVFCILANHLGYKASMCHGRYTNGRGRGNDHYWCYVVMDGHKKYFDVQIANWFWKKKHSMAKVNNYYKKNKGDAIWRKHHRG